MSPPGGGVVLAFPRVLSDGQSTRLSTRRSSEPCCDPHLGLWVNLGLFLLLNFHAGVARGLDLWRNETFGGSSTFGLGSGAVSTCD